jgi:hypothetical protein
MAGTCECGNKSSGSIKWGKFLDWLRTGYLLKKGFAPWSKLLKFMTELVQNIVSCALLRKRKLTFDFYLKKEEILGYINDL